MQDECRRLLPDVTVLIRGLRAKEIHTQTGKIKKHAFIPRRNGKDDDGLSVSQAGSDSAAELRLRVPNGDGIFCELRAGRVRDIQEERIRLEVWQSPTERDPYHALIVGVPVDPLESALASRLAERLAGISALCQPLTVGSHAQGH